MNKETKARLGGAPLSVPSNPFSNGEEFEDGPNIQGEVDAVEAEARSNLDGYGASAPVTSDAAAGRPLNPPTAFGR